MDTPSPQAASPGDAFPFSPADAVILGSLRTEPISGPLPGACHYTAENPGDGLEYRFPAGSLADAHTLTMDMLAEGNHLPVFRLSLHEGEDGPVFHLDFGLLNQCQARVRFPLEATSGNRWRYPREGAWLKPYCGGKRVDLSRVSRLTLAVLRKSERPVHWWQTPLTATREEPPLLTHPALPGGALIDELGQSTLHDWKEKTRSADEVTSRIRAQQATATSASWPNCFSRWGGWKGKRVESTGFFRTHHDGRRWWLVDPDGCLFWSAGMNCVRVDTGASIDGLEDALSWRPDPSGPFAAIYHKGYEGQVINYLAANFIRAFGQETWYERWAEAALAELRRCGFNTVANWSDWQIARDAGFPYVRPLNLHLRATPMIFRDFPDVFHPSFQAEAEEFAQQLRETADDPAFIGYFLMNEPTWGFASETPAEGMLFNTEGSPSRTALAEFLRERYTDDGLARAWGIDVDLSHIQRGAWTEPLTDAARQDLVQFSGILAGKLFRSLSNACRKVDPNHLNLGARYYTIPPEWALQGMESFNVFSLNSYRQRIPSEEVTRISGKLKLPVLIGEWHFGALDVGLPGSGIGHVPDQESRGKAFRIYVEDAAAHRSCIGVHYFTLYDESALGRYDGENWNIGFIDVCNRRYEPLCRAARASHERLYSLAVGDQTPYDNEPVYLPLLFL